MNPLLAAASARSLALRVLLECRKKDAFVHEILDANLGLTSLSSPDRRLATELVYGVLRRRGTLDALIRLRLHRPLHQVEPWIIETLRLGVYQLFLLTHIPPHAALNETVDLANHMHTPRAKGFINGVLRALLPLQTQDYAEAPGPDALPMAHGSYRRLHARVLPDPASSPVEYVTQGFSLPGWLAVRWLARLAWDECVRLGFWFAGPAPLTLRINRLRCERAAFLARAGERAEAGVHPQAVTWRSHQPIAEIPGYEEGFFVVQDETAMRVASAVAPQPGDKVLDLCAAPGGKTTHLAELMNDQGTLMACEIEARKLQPLEETCRRLGLTMIQPKVIENGPTKAHELLHGPFDAVLADVPCSNTGVLGRRPEARWRLKPADLPHLVSLQRRLLQQACDCVRSGGTVVYSTCSIEPEENREVVEAVLATQPDFMLEADEQALPGRPGDGGYWAKLRRRG